MKTEFIHRFIRGSAEYARTLLLLHGTGGDENDLLALGKAIDPGASLLSPRGRVLENGANRFFRRLAEGVFDEEDVVQRSHELAGFIREALAEYGLSQGELVAVGYSNGANIASAMMMLGLAPFERAILLRAMVPLTNEQNAQPALQTILIAEGEYDPIAPPAEGRELARRLRARGANVDLIFQRAGHELLTEDVEQARRWLDETAL